MNNKVYATITLELRKGGIIATCEEIDEEVFIQHGDSEALMRFVNGINDCIDPNATDKGRESLERLEEVSIATIEFLRDIAPSCASSTGYMQYKKLRVTYSNGKESEVQISNWYTSREEQLAELKAHLYSMRFRGCHVELKDKDVESFFECLK